MSVYYNVYFNDKGHDQVATVTCSDAERLQASLKYYGKGLKNLAPHAHYVEIISISRKDGEPVNSTYLSIEEFIDEYVE